MKIFMQIKEDDGSLMGYGSTRSYDSEIEYEVEDDHEVLYNPLVYKFLGNQLIKDDDYILQKTKDKKEIELNQLCEKTILGRFSVELFGLTYEFSYDEQSQSRLNGTASLFLSDLITEIPWTAYLYGERQRINLNKAAFNKVSVAALMHCNENIIKYNELLAKVKSAKSLDELNEINW